MYASKSQARLFRAKEARGELPAGTAAEWAHETPDMGALPERKKPRKRVRTPKDLEAHGRRLLDGLRG